MRADRAASFPAPATTLEENVSRFRLRPLLILTVLLVGTAFSATAATDIGLSHGTNKHRPEFLFDVNSSYQLQAAQNEWEPFLVLMRDDEGLTNVNLTVTDFTGPGEAITDVEFYRVHYVPVAADEISHHPSDPNKAGWWPDGLVPFVDHFVGEVRDGAPFDVVADFSQAVFADVFIPAGQTPGIYTATVTVTADDRPEWSGDVTLEVWNFALPNELSLESHYSYDQEDMCDYHTAHGNPPDCDTLNDWYFKEYARHRMSPYRWEKFRPAYEYNEETQTLTVDWTDWDAAHGQYLDGEFYLPGYEFQSIAIPRSFGGVPEGVTQDQWNFLHWSAWGDHFREKGWLEKAWMYMPDEPDPSQYDDLAAMAAKLHEADPDLQPFITEQYDERLGDDIDIWCPDEPLFSDSMPFPPYPEEYDRLRAEGAKTWWYNCVSATIGLDYANHMVDQESSYMRIWLWLTRRYNFTGILFWRINYLWGRQDVWEDMYADKFLCQGDGTMFYPGTIDKIGGETDVPIPSIRIKVLREAMEDYEYLHILDEMGENEWVDNVTRTVAPKTYQWEHDWQKLLQWRTTVAKKILGTLDEDAPATPTDLVGAADIESVDLSWTAPDDADLAGYDIWYGLFPGDRLFAGSIDDGATAATIENMPAGEKILAWINAYDEQGNRSADSDVVEVTPLADGDDDTADDSFDRNSVSIGKPAGGDDDDGGASSDDDDDDDLNSGCGGW
jgi:Glycoside hydrolase 123, catalytic domain